MTTTPISSRSAASLDTAPRTATDAATRATAAARLRADHVTAGYRDTTVVHEACVAIRPGAVTALVGPNGSGKSTLLRSLARLHRPDSGEVLMEDGRCSDALTARDFARCVSLLSQHRPTPAGLRIADVVAFGRHPYRGRWRGGDPDGAEAVAWAMDVTGIDDMGERPVDELSGGELQRVWLATCLAQRTGVLLLDEPTNHLDLRYQIETLDLIRDLATEHGVAVGVVLHDLAHAAEVADTVVLLHRGAVLAQGTAVAVLNEEHLRTAYGIPVRVTHDPLTGALSLRPVGRHTRVPA